MGIPPSEAPAPALRDDEAERDRRIRRMRSRCPRQCDTVRNMRATAKQRGCDREEKRRMCCEFVLLHFMGRFCPESGGTIYVWYRRIRR